MPFSKKLFVLDSAFYKFSFGVPAVGGLKFSIAQKNCKKCQLGEVLVGGSASWGKC